MIEYVEKRCRSLTDAQRQQLAVTMDDIIFMLPEDVSVVFDQYGEFRTISHHTVRCMYRLRTLNDRSDLRTLELQNMPSIRVPFWSGLRSLKTGTNLNCFTAQLEGTSSNRCCSPKDVKLSTLSS